MMWTISLTHGTCQIAGSLTFQNKRLEI